MANEIPVTDADLHAYVDGELSEARRAIVEAWLKENPERQREIDEIMQVNMELHNLLDPVLGEPVPDSLGSVPQRRFMYRLAAAAAFIVVGIMAGWHANSLYTDSKGISLDEHLVKPATFAHYVYASEKKHPVEVSIEQEQHLIDWLSNRLHTKLRPPSLLQHGYELVGGRLLPSTNRMAAQFMYEGKNGNRITLYIRRIKSAASESMFQFSRRNEINTFYWIEGEVGYAVSGSLAREELMGVAHTSYQQIQPNM